MVTTEYLRDHPTEDPPEAALLILISIGTTREGKTIDSLDISRVSPTWASVTTHKAYRWAQDHGLAVEKLESHQNAYEPRTASLENLSGIGIPDVVKMAGRAKPVARAGQ